MFDRLLNRGLTLAVVVLETVAGGGGLILLLSAWKHLLAGQWVGAVANLLCALCSVVAVWWLVRHHEELKG